MQNCKRIKIQLNKARYRVEFLGQRFYQTINLMEKLYYLQLLNIELMKMYYLIVNLEKYTTIVVNNYVGNRNMMVFTKKELKNFDGLNENPAYVAVDGIVYDVTLNSTWNNGDHFGIMAGKDVTSDFKNCHGDDMVLKNLRIVGKLVK